MKTIVFVRDRPNIRVFKLAKALKFTNMYKVICICRTLKYDEELFNGIFDEVYYYSPHFNFNRQIDVSFNKRWNKKYKLGFRKALKLINKIKPDIIHTMAEPYDIIAYLIKNSKFSVVLDETDFTGISEGIENINPKIREMEKYCFENASGICHKGAPYEIEYYRQHGYKINCPILPWFENCDEDLFADTNVRKLSVDDKELHLVYTGGVSTNPGVVYNYYIPLAKELAKQKTHFHLYPLFGSVREKHKNSYEYLELEKETKYFHFHNSLPLKKMIKEIAKYDWGIWIHPVYGDKCIPRMVDSKQKTSIGNKIFSYLEEGLPIIVSDHLEYGKEIVEKYKIGFAIKDKELPNLRSLIEKQNYPELRENVFKAREELSLSKQVSRLDKFYNQFF